MRIKGEWQKENGIARYTLVCCGDASLDFMVLFVIMLLSRQERLVLGGIDDV